VQPQIFATEEAIGRTVADEIVAGLAQATAAGRPYALGAPSGRTPRSTYQALAGLLETRRDVDLGLLHIVMMDDYVVRTARGAFTRVDAALPYSCERFGRDEILAPIAAATGSVIPDANLHLPEAADPGAYDDLITSLGGVDLFVLASGATDGHVAFNPTGSPVDSLTRVVELSPETRRDNMDTFAPHFHTIDDVPRYGITVGVGTILRATRRAVMLLIGESKRTAATTIAAATSYQPAWPATVVAACRNPSLYLDEAAADAIAVDTRGAR
jgi:glucosamine-6-phosphate deaminase